MTEKMRASQAARSEYSGTQPDWRDMCPQAEDNKQDNWGNDDKRSCSNDAPEDDHAPSGPAHSDDKLLVTTASANHFDP